MKKIKTGKQIIHKKKAKKTLLARLRYQCELTAKYCQAHADGDKLLDIDHEFLRHFAASCTEVAKHSEVNDEKELYDLLNELAERVHIHFSAPVPNALQEPEIEDLVQRIYRIHHPDSPGP